MKQLKDLTREEYNKLNKSGMLFEIYPEAEGLYIDDCKGQIEPLVIWTDGYYCKECGQLCFVYNQGLSCHCGQGGWENEKYYEEDYPAKWIKVKIEVRSA